MKKLLTLLSAVILTSSAALPIQGLTYNKGTKSADRRDAEYTADFTSRALRGAILNDQTVQIRGNVNTGIDYSYATNYFGNQKIKDVAPQYFKRNQGAKPGGQELVSTAYNTLFGRDENGYNYTVMKSVNDGDLKTSLNLSNGIAPDDKTQSLISAGISAARVAFGNDFTADLASTFVNLLSGKGISSEITGSDDAKNIFVKLDGILSNYSTELTQAVTALAQKDAKSVTMQDKLEDSTNNLFKALIYFTATRSDNGKTVHQVFDEDADATKYGNASQRFWNHLLNSSNGKDDGLKDATGDDTSNTISQMSNIIDFAMSLLHYFRSFDRYTKKISPYVDGSNIFSDKKLNGEIKKEVLSTKYFYDSAVQQNLDSDIPADSNDYYWYSDGDSHYMKLNLQNLFSDLNYYFSPDFNGYQTLKPFNILLGGVYDEKAKTNKLNPIMDVALTPLLNIAKTTLGKALSSILDTVSKIPVAQLKDLVNQINDLINNLPEYGASLLDWLSTDNGSESGKFPTVLGQLVGLINNVGLFNSKKSARNVYRKVSSLLSDMSANDAKNNPDKTPEEIQSELDKNKNIAKIAVSALQFLGTYGGQLIKKPWTLIYRGQIFNKISQTAYFDPEIGASDKTSELGYGLSQLSDLKTIFTMTSIDKIVLNVGHLMGYYTENKKNLVLPDWLYASKDYTISKLFKELATTIYKTNKFNTLDKNQDYSLNSGVFLDALNSLIPHKDDETNNIRISRHVKTIDQSVYGDDGSSPILKTASYDGTNTISIETANISDETIVNKPDSINFNDNGEIDADFEAKLTSDISKKDWNNGNNKIFKVYNSDNEEVSSAKIELADSTDVKFPLEKDSTHKFKVLFNVSDIHDIENTNFIVKEFDPTSKEDLGTQVTEIKVPTRYVELVDSEGNEIKISSVNISNGKIQITLDKPLEQRDEVYGQNIRFTELIKDGNNVDKNGKPIINIKSSSVGTTVLAKGKQDTLETVSPIMSLFYSLQNYSANQQGLDSLKLANGIFWDYDIKLPNEDNLRQLISNEPITFSDTKNTGNVNANALNYILGLGTNDKGKTVFTNSSIFQAISKLYGHNYADKTNYLDMTNGAQSIFALANTFADLASRSIDEVVKDNYQQYLNEKNWKLKNIAYTNLSPKTALPSEQQSIQYDIVYYNPYENKSYTYHIKLIRNPYDSQSKVGWKVVQLDKIN